MKTNLKLAAAVVALTALGACTAEKAIDNTVDTALFASRTVVKGTVGAGKLAVKGTRAAVGAGSGAE